MGPSVRNLLVRYKLDPSQINSTGPHQTLLKSDVLSYMSQKNLNGQPQGGSQNLAIHNAASQATRNRVLISSATDRYKRQTYLSELEIEVINSGGIFEPKEKPTAKPQKR